MPSRVLEGISRKRILVILIISILLFMYSAPIYQFESLRDMNQMFISHTKEIWSGKSKFVVRTNGCRIMDMDPWDPAVKRFIKSRAKKNCSKPLVYIDDETPKMNKSALSNWNYSQPYCCYREVKRVAQNPAKYNENADWEYSEDGNCTEIGSSNVTLPEFLRIECKNGTNSTTMVEYGAIVHPPDSHSNVTGVKASHWSTIPKSTRPPSILIIGIDSISRLHMHRSLPQTKKFLETQDFVEMKGYNKIGENTFPNMMGVMVGLELKKYSSCWKTNKDKLDNCPFIWKDFDRANYSTSLVEDAPGIATFNYIKTGFVAQPTDYYLRPLMVAKAKHRGKGMGSSDGSCIGGVTPTEFLARYIKDIVRKVTPSTPYFLHSWFTTAAHDDFNGLQAFDSVFLDLIQSSLALDPNNTVIIFLSDHGYRFGSFRESFLGYYEESLPFFWIRLPPSLKSAHPDWLPNLLDNAHKLSSPLDLHATFWHILETTTNGSVHQNPLPSNQTAIRYSLFKEIPTNRTCEDAGISQQYCRCGVAPMEGGTKFGLNTNLGEVVISRVNSILQKVIKSGTCASLTFSKFLYGREISDGEIWNGFGTFVPYKDYLVALETRPSKAHFEAKLRAFGNGTEEVLGPPARINSYQGQSDCVSDPVLKLYCYCTSIKN